MTFPRTALLAAVWTVACVPTKTTVDMESEQKGPFPAFSFDWPTVKKQSGQPIASPKFVAITFDGDPFRADLDSFVSQLGQTNYWKVVNQEYGVGPATALAPVHTTNAPASISSDQIRTWLGNSVGTPGWPSTPTDTIFAIFYPAGTRVVDGNIESCQNWAGVHSQTALPGTATPIVYAIIPRCMFDGRDPLDLATFVGSHELIESAQNPVHATAPAYVGTDDAHVAWNKWYGGEVETTDLCGGQAYRPPEFKYEVQRSWSNSQVAAGKDPCLPSDQTAYFAAAPITAADNLNILLDGKSLMTRGFTVSGASRILDIGLATGAPINSSTPVFVEVSDLTQAALKQASPVTFSLDKNQGWNGEHFQLTITKKSVGLALFTVQAFLGTTPRTWVGFVQTM